ncbi:hypothetical protein BDA99DRAFT_570852 [Phascolomyces articulosus]|uniref:PH domain-containing protein n=1 Tax=Phascolomyces articulosus TaxID=60185 RepID=A0AAD5PER9_9FUNG|nr:hypothetical protein BDA99DRAFT_570852 [Phascolomyces articulosus]
MAVTATTANSFIVRPPPRSSSLRRPSNNNNNNTTATTPRAGWLSKLSQSYGIGNKQRWQTRFFILLDTELRCYKNEHSQTPSSVIDLHAICQPVVMTSSINGQAHCFRLEPTTREGNHNRPLTIACQSAQELSVWVAALRSIIYKLKYQQEQLSPPRQQFTHGGIKEPMTVQQQQQQQKETIHRCHYEEESISRRRGVLIPPLMVHPLDEIPTTVMVQSPVLSDTTTTSEEDDEETVEQVEARIAYVAGQRNSHATVVKNDTMALNNENLANANPTTTTTDRRKLSSYSPTFLLYQERFHLLNNN